MNIWWLIGLNGEDYYSEMMVLKSKDRMKPNVVKNAQKISFWITLVVFHLLLKYWQLLKQILWLWNSQTIFFSHIFEITFIFNRYSVEYVYAWYCMWVKLTSSGNVSTDIYIFFPQFGINTVQKFLIRIANTIQNGSGL